MLVSDDSQPGLGPGEVQLTTRAQTPLAAEEEVHDETPRSVIFIVRVKAWYLKIFTGDFSLPDLVGLAQTFGNIEFLGCTYPPDTMRQVGLGRSEGLSLH